MRPDQDSSVKAVRPIAAIAQVSTSGTSIRMASNIRKISKCNTSCTRVINSQYLCPPQNVHSTMRFLKCAFYNAFAPGCSYVIQRSLPHCGPTTNSSRCTVSISACLPCFLLCTVAIGVYLHWFLHFNFALFPSFPFFALCKTMHFCPVFFNHCLCAFLNCCNLCGLWGFLFLLVRNVSFFQFCIRSFIELSFISFVQLLSIVSSQSSILWLHFLSSIWPPSVLPATGSLMLVSWARTALFFFPESSVLILAIWSANIVVLVY